MEHVYILPGHPIPLARPRLSKGNVWDPQFKEKKDAQTYLVVQHNKKPLYIGALHIKATFYMPIPQSTSSKRAALLSGSNHIKRPDIDNLIKYLLDVSAGILFKDDCIISSIHAQKIYSPDPRTEFTITRLL